MGVQLKSRSKTVWAWVLLLRKDPCVYCNKPSGTADHIVPRSHVKPNAAGHWILSSTGFSRDHWTNLTAACEECNFRRQNTPLLMFLLMERLNDFDPQRVARLR